MLSPGWAALPTGWSNVDLGSPGVAGSASEASGIFTVLGAGVNDWQVDKGQFVYKTALADCAIQTKVTYRQGGDSTNARAGVMIRNGLGSNNSWIFVGLTGWGVHWKMHPNGGDDWGYQELGNGETIPYWVKITRVGSTLTAWKSTDGTSWTSLTSMTLSGPVYLGLIVSSNTSNSLTTGKFESVLASGTLPWSGQDIGAPGAAGSYSQTGSAFSVSGAGSLNWNNDQLQYVYMPCSGNGTGDGSIVVRLTAEGVNGAGLAGIAFRDNLTPDSSEVYLMHTPGGLVRMRTQKATEGWGSTNEAVMALPCWLKLQRVGTGITASYSSNGTTWTQLGGTVVNVAWPTQMYVGMMVNSGGSTLHAGQFDNVATTGTNPLTAGWTSLDLGNAGLPGSGTEVIVPNDRFTVKGAGTGFVGNTDSGQFVYRSVTGNNQIVARVGAFSGATSTTAPTALMIRDVLGTASMNALISVSADNVLRFQSHLTAAGTTSTTVTVNGVVAPYWIKLARVGNVITGYYSQDGWNWMTAGSATIAMNTNAYMGMAVSSKNAAQYNTAIYDYVTVGAVSNLPPATIPIMTDILSMPGVTKIDEINTATATPVYESAAGVSQGGVTVAGQSARVMPTVDGSGNPLAIGDTAGTIAYVIGAGKGLVAGNAYILTVEYPDDQPRSMYITNRGADYTRGLATGTSVGDARQQFAEASLESLNYPQTGAWKVHKQYFHLLDRFQGVVGLRDPAVGYRPYSPSQGFHVVVTRMKRLNDPRSVGAATGYIRLYSVSNPSGLYAQINYPPANLPRRSIFWREEMADGLLQSTGNPLDFAVSDPVNWYLHKMKMAKVLGINTLAKDLLEFGYNQGWDSGDENWVTNAQPPAKDLWNRLVPKATEEGFDLLPYFEYKGGLGVYGQSLGDQRRAQKLYHNIKSTCGNSAYYDCIWWTENNNSDVTDPDTLVDAKRMLDRTVGDLKTKARFTGAWFRMRGNHLPMSFASTTVARFNADKGMSETRTSLISSYEGDKNIYNQYVDWWFLKRKSFLIAIRDYLRNDLGITGAQIIFTPWTSESVPTVHSLGAFFNHVGVVTETSSASWWTTFSDGLGEGWWKYQWQPSEYSTVVPANTANNWYRGVLSERPPIIHGMNSQFVEDFHSSPSADPWNYTTTDGVMMTYPAGRLYAVEDGALMNEFKCQSGLTILKHYSLNEDNANPGANPSPFDGQLGYLSVDCDRAGDHLMLQQARVIAKSDPRNIGYLAASSFSTGYPEIMRKFNQAFLAVPALPSTIVTGTGAPSNAAVVMRQITTTGQGTYAYVVNTSMSPLTVTWTLPGTGTVKELVTNQTLASKTITATLTSGELRSYRVGP
jgi:regulation of enolase protein 1 (concanavalin A-like superfamily)